MRMPRRANEAGSGTLELVIANFVSAPNSTGVPENSKATTAPIGPGPGALNVHSNEAGPPVAGDKSMVTTETPSLEIVVPAGPDTKVKSEIAVELYVKLKSEAVAPGGLVRVKLAVVSTVIDPAWLGVANAKVASSPAAKARKNDLFIIENSLQGMSLAGGTGIFLRLPLLDANRSRRNAG